MICISTGPEIWCEVAGIAYNVNNFSKCHVHNAGIPTPIYLLEHIERRRICTAASLHHAHSAAVGSSLTPDECAMHAVKKCVEDILNLNVEKKLTMA